MNSKIIIDKENGLSNFHAEQLKKTTSSFLKKCDNGKSFKLTTKSDASAFSTCFGIFLAQLCGNLNEYQNRFDAMSIFLVEELKKYKIDREKYINLSNDKPFMQLCAFTLSALHLLKTKEQYPMMFLREILPSNIKEYLRGINTFRGAPQTGNLAMCMFVLAYYCSETLEESNQSFRDEWVNEHLKNMNSNGFWGVAENKYLQFQNGYHQYEIFEFLNTKSKKMTNVSEFVKKFSDKNYQFAPYYGDSGCYDYDAIFLITFLKNNLIDNSTLEVLIKNCCTLINQQNFDGGFSESKSIRPRSFMNIANNFNHIFIKDKNIMKDRLNYFLAYLLPRYNKIHTHWTNYSREWGESNLWDTWFRLLTIARIDCYINENNFNRWGFINYPGIGYHSR